MIEAASISREKVIEPNILQGSELQAEPNDEEKYTIPFGDDENKMEYSVLESLTGGYCINRLQYRNSIPSSISCLYEDGLWHNLADSNLHGTSLKHFETREQALAAVRADAAYLGLSEKDTLAIKDIPEEATYSIQDQEIYHARLREAGFHPTGTDFYGKHEYKSSVPASDGGMYCLRLFQSQNGIGLHSHYEKYNIIDGHRTVDATFDSLDKALEFVGGYHLPVEYQNVEKQQSPRIRMC